jgi:hypothetical protein
VIDAAEVPLRPVGKKATAKQGARSQRVPLVTSCPSS